MTAHKSDWDLFFIILKVILEAILCITFINILSKCF